MGFRPNLLQIPLSQQEVLTTPASSTSWEVLCDCHPTDQLPYMLAWERHFIVLQPDPSTLQEYLTQ